MKLMKVYERIHLKKIKFESNHHFMKKYLFFSVLYVLSLVSCSSDDSSPIDNTPLEAETRLNVSYGSNPQQVYDLYLPAGRTTTDTKVIMLIHGGGWTSGDKSDMSASVAFLQTLHPGHAIVNVNYVLADAQNPAFPNQFLDIKSIVSKLTAESVELQIKPEFGMVGTSAGAHIAMMYDYKYDTNNQVKFVANIVGPSDFTDPFFVDNFPIEPIIDQLVDEDAYPVGTNFLEELSPVFHVSAIASPTCMFYGNEDPLVPEENGTTLKVKLDANGVENTLRIYNGGHGNDWSNVDLLEAQGIINEYISEYL